MLKTFCRHLSLSVCFVAGLATAHAAEKEVVATVNGYEITAEMIELAREDIGPALGQVPEQQQNAVLVNFLIDMHLLSEKAKAEDFEKSDEFKQRNAYYTQRALMMAMVNAHTAKTVTDEAALAYYNEVKDKMVEDGAEEVRARHILVKTEDEAKAIVEELKGGKDFEELAKEKSTGPSGPNGGDLGYFGKGSMVPAFEEAAFALEVGAVSEPVETRFGWHVIKLEDKRTQQPPAFEEVKDQVKEVLQRQARNDLVRDVRNGVELTIGGQTIPPMEAPKPEPKKE